MLYAFVYVAALNGVGVKAILSGCRRRRVSRQQLTTGGQQAKGHERDWAVRGHLH